MQRLSSILSRIFDSENGLWFFTCHFVSIVLEAVPSLASIRLLFDNPYLLKRLNPPPAELHANVEAQNAALGTHRRTGKDEDLNTPGASIDEDAYLNHTWTRPFDSPLCAIGTTSLKYEQELGGVSHRDRRSRDIPDLVHCDPFGNSFCAVTVAAR